MDYTKEACRIWFKRIKVELGMSPTAIAEQLGITQSTINMPLRKNNDKVVSLKTLKLVADFLIEQSLLHPHLSDAVWDILADTKDLFGFIVAQRNAESATSLSPKVKLSLSDQPLVAREGTAKQASPPRPYMADYLTDPRSIPVLGTAAGSALGAFEIGNEAIDHVRRPPGLAGIKEIYAIYVIGESMVPEHNPGDLRIIHPHRPAKPGDSVVIQTYNAATDTREAFIKRLISMNGHEVKCYQHNPHLDITYIRPNGDPNANNTDETYAIKVHKVLTVNELHGF